MSTITATDFKAHLSAWLDQVEHHHETVDVVRHGQVVARVIPVAPVQDWKALRKMACGKIRPGESVLKDSDFEALA
jgi:prevent-host-death family protein